MSLDAAVGGLVARGLGDPQRIEWPLVRSSEIFELRYGKALVEGLRRQGSVPVFGSNGRTGSHDTPLFAGPGVVLGRKGAGHLGVHWSDVDFWVIDTAYSLEVAERIDLRFAYYLIGYVGLDHLKHGTSNPSLTRDAFAAQYFPVPPLTDQRRIAAALSSLDDKIESNRRLAAGISDLMEARIEQALHGDRRTLPVSDLGTFVNGGAYTKGASGAGRLVIRIAELNKGPGPSTVYNDIDVPEDKTARFGDILMSWSGSLGVYRWTREEAIINQHIFKVIPGAYPAWLVFDRLNAAIEVFRGIAKDKATTMGHIQRSHLETTFVDVPTDSAIKVLDNELSPLWDRLLVAERESLTLADLRDTLLPALLSGTIRVFDENDSMTGAEVEGEG